MREGGEEFLETNTRRLFIYGSYMHMAARFFFTYVSILDAQSVAKLNELYSDFDMFH